MTAIQFPPYTPLRAAVWGDSKQGGISLPRSGDFHRVGPLLTQFVWTKEKAG